MLSLEYKQRDQITTVNTEILPRDIPSLNISIKMMLREISAMQGISTNKIKYSDLCLYCKKHGGLLTPLWYFQMQAN